MKTFRRAALVALGLLLQGSLCSEAIGQNEAAHLTEDETNSWSFSASLYGFIVPESRDYLNPNLTADRGWLHLEARYNYESLETASLWVGYNFSAGEKLVFEFTPVLGGVFGDLTGIAPGWNLALSYHQLTLSSQNEYVFDVGNSSGDFFYTWSELSYGPWDWLRVGIAAQRTKAYKSDLDIQRGFLVGFAYNRVEFTTYVFNLGWTDPTIVLSVAFQF